VKRSSAGGFIFSNLLTGNSSGFFVEYVDTLKLGEYAGGSPSWQLETVSVFRDPCAWYAFQIVFDTTQATAANRIRVYVNGVQVTSFSGSSPSQNSIGSWNNTNLHTIGRNGSNPQSFDGYLADIHFIDGQALTPSSFGEFDTNGIWQPKAYTGTYGTNGFKLDFADNSSNTATTLGKDTSGNGNNWTPNNLSVGGGGITVNGISGYGAIEFGTATNVFSGNPQFSAVFGGRPNNVGVAFNAVTAQYKVRVLCSSESGTIYINNTINTGQNSQWPTFAWKDVSSSLTFPLTITSVGYAGGRAFDGGYISAIEVDDKLLITTSFFANTDSLVDSPSILAGQTDSGAGGTVVGNYATLNPLQNGTTHTLSDGNLRITGGATGVYASTLATVGMSSGKWYWEQTLTSLVAQDIQLGIGNRDTNLGGYPGFTSRSYGFSSNSLKWNSGGSAVYTTSWGNGDIIGLAFDADAGSLTLYKNGVSLGVAFSGIPADTYFPAAAAYTSSSVSNLNFGQRPFAYTAPSGYKALCTANLPAPVVTKPSTVMDVVLYTGTGSTLTPTSSLGFSPDLVWIKGRSGATDHALYDTVRGAQARLESNTTDAEVTTDGGVTAFNSNGFTLGTLAQVNTNTATYAAWCWDAGSSNVVNTQGSITSTVRANPSAGFSIVTYTGNGTNGATVGHGLGVSPSMVIVKSRSGAYEWPVYHSSLSAGNNLFLHLTNAQNSVSGTVTAGGVGGASSTTFTCTQGVSNINNTNATSATYVAYCFAPVSGYSSFGSYTGNGNASNDGPFVYTGFRPRWVMIKSTSSGNWTIFDALRVGYNVDNEVVYPNLASGSGVDNDRRIDILSNGFKIRNTAFGSTDINGTTATTYIYAAFAENPFSISRAR
jgi:hypothetical protein